MLASYKEKRSFIYFEPLVFCVIKFSTDILRRLARFFKVGEPLLDLLGLIAISGFMVRYFPMGVLTAGPATGGDTGSHFWPLVTLVNNGIPEGTLRMWNPGNLGGEPHLVHYFPLPYLVMAFLSLFAPLGAAFNIGSLLPLVLLPLSVYFGVRLMGWRFPAPILATCASLPFLYNESFSMWGGNTLSTMAGQFAHVYALCFALIGVGCLCYEIRRKQFPFWSSIAFASVCLSHAYVMVGLPLLFISIVLFAPGKWEKSRVLIPLMSGILALLLSLWFLLPMLQNAEWNTAYFFIWYSENLIKEVVPPIFYPVLFLLVGSLVGISLFYRGRTRVSVWKACLLWALPCIGYYGLYFVFPALGLVDVRAFPQVQLFVCVLAGAASGVLFRRVRLLAFLTVAPIVTLSLVWVDGFAINFPGWVRWNYSGWTTKVAYPDLTKMYDHLRGDFSMPRVIYEHNGFNNRAGTERVFEMLPYFANRATYESVYLQASILAPAAFLLQAEVSKTPSCPFAQFNCPRYNIQGVKDRLALLGVGELILLTKELTDQAEQASFLRNDGVFGPWTLYATREQPALVEVFKTPPLLTTDPLWRTKYKRSIHDLKKQKWLEEPLPQSPDWKEIFYYWLRDFDPALPMIIADRGDRDVNFEELRTGNFRPDSPWTREGVCTPSLKVEINRMVLNTPCPGRAHYLKFAFHSTFKADSGDPLYLVSPGFIAIVPSKSEVTLDFGQSRVWKIAGYLSIVVFMMLFAIKLPFLRAKVERCFR